MNPALCAAPSPPRRVPPPVALVTPVQFHGEEVTVRSGAGWLGLVEQKGHFSWRPYSIRVLRAEDPTASS